jgi:hypothetical protein
MTFGRWRSIGTNGVWQMNGYDLGRAVGAQIIGLILVAFAVGGILALGGYLFLSWLVAHITIGWAA